MGSDEYRGPAREEEEEPEELAEAAAASGGAAAGGSQTPPPSEEPEEFEELEAVEEEEEKVLTEAQRAEETEADRVNELAALGRTGAIKAWTIEDLNRLVEEGKSAIVMEDGVFRIKEEVYQAGERVREKREENALREIAQEVVRREKESAEHPPAAEPAEEPGTAGIGDLLRDEDTLDLSKVLSGEKGPVAEEALSLDREKSNPLRLKRNGLDYDEFLSSYPRSFTHTIQMKSLVEVSRRVSAVSAGIMLKKIQGFAPDLTVGLSDKSIQNCVFASNEPFTSDFLQARKAVAIDKNPSEVRFLRSRFDQEDIRYMKRILFIPVVFRGQEAYLFLSFSGETDITINVMLSKLIVR
jgi:hypothetical protein